MSSVTNFFIPKKVMAGFQKRQGTFTNRLGFVIYYDSKGILRQKKSFDGWRDKTIPTEEIDNIPTSGFVLNKGIQRGGWSHFSSNRSMIRIYDPRGVEFEITPQNLVWILMHVDCSKKEIQDKLVYAWDGKNLVLLPSSSEEYKSAQKFTKLKDKKVFTKELKEGRLYLDNKQKEYVYLGKRLFYDRSRSYDIRTKLNTIGKNQHVFCDTEGSRFISPNSIPGTFAKCLNEDCVDNYAELVELFHKDIKSTKIVGCDVRDEIENFWSERHYGYNNYWSGFFCKKNNQIYKFRVRDIRSHDVTKYNYIYEIKTLDGINVENITITKEDKVYSSIYPIGENGERYYDYR